MLIDLLRGTLSTNDIIILLLSIPITLLSLSLHETAHGYIAYKMGDPTAKNLGRLTLNPIKHLDLVGTICMIFFHYGWAKPVPINTRNFNNPKKGMVLTALAGPVSNFLLAVVFMILNAILSVVSYIFPPMDQSTAIIYLIFDMFFFYGAYMNVTLAVFNMLPIPPFDGSRVFLSFLPPKMYFGIMKYERIILIVTLVLLGSGILSLPISTVTHFIINGIYSAIYGLIGLVL